MTRKLLLAIALPALLLFVCEGALRATGRPHGTFAGTESTADLWERSAAQDMHFGPIPYRVQANSQGFRGPELRGPSDPPAVRIAAIGDSMTDGFFVDDDATYPYFLQQLLKQRGIDAEVVNAARGGGSIDLFAQRLERHVLPLDPDIVIVSFVTNDLHELGRAARGPGRDAVSRLAGVFTSRSALGETLMELQLWLRGAGAGVDDRVSDIELSGPARYRIPGGERYAENARSFLERYRQVDAALLSDPLPADLQARLEDEYRPQLEHFRDLCAQRGIALLYVYFPAYPQIYLAGAPSAIQDRLAEFAARLGIPFLDLGDALRDASVEGPLHLAPIDYHLNPRGNRVVARAIADALSRHDLLPKPAAR